MIVKPGREIDVKRGRELGIACVADMVLKNCTVLKRYLRFLTEEETEYCITRETERTLPAGLPRPTILDRLGSHLTVLVSKRVHDLANRTTRVSTNGKTPRKPKRIKSLWSQRPTGAHKAGDSARFYRAVKEQAAALAKGQVAEVQESKSRITN